jgi:alpha-ketoglutarate-dependent 2,4-dichlorophenoxyacetate dioxygenase
MRIPLYEIFDVSNLNIKNEIDDRSDPWRAAGANGNATWHADGAFNPRRTGLSLLRAVEIPPKEVGGHTEYIDSRTAYDDLSPSMKERIEEYVTCNSIFHNRKTANPDSPLFKDIDVMKNITSRHMLVQTHEPSGRKNLYITSYAHHIEGLDIEEGQKLLDELREHCKQEKYRFDLHWENPGDVAIWDNTAVLHRATQGSFLRTHRRDVRRVSVFDMTKWGYGLNTVEDAIGQAPSQ